jgi:Fe2+ transport system protein FeoA
MQLWELQAGVCARVSHLSKIIDAKLHERLAEMGFDIGQDVACVRRSPFGGPIVVSLGGTIIALEQSIAALIQVQTDVMSNL